MFTKILVGYDRSKGAKDALSRAIVLAKEFKTQLTALWVREPSTRFSDLPGEFEGEAEAADEFYTTCRKEIEALAAQQDLTVRCDVRRGHPAKIIQRYAEEGEYDLIVVGHSDHSELWGRLLGDTADRISDHAHCSVLIVKEYRKRIHH